MTLPVWLYWEGALPHWIEACQRTVFAHAEDVRLVTPAEFARLRDVDGDIDLEPLNVAHRADFIRAFLLARYGGLWVDSDCVVLRRLEPVLQLLARFDFVGYKERQGHVANNFMGAPQGSPVAARYYERVCAILRAHEPLEWLTLGSYALTKTINETGATWHRLAVELVQPICWSQPAAFFLCADDETHARNFNERAYCYMLSDNMVRGYAAEHEGADLLADGTFFRYLLRRADTSKPCACAPVRPTRSSSVNTCSFQQLPFCVETLLAVAPERVLDASIGYGRWGMLVREFCDEWQGRNYREHWRVQLEGIAECAQHVEEHQHFFYNWIHVADAAEWLQQTETRWHLIILGDALPQWPAPKAQAAIERALDLADYVLVNVPIGAHWNGAANNGHHEPAHTAWTLDELLAHAPVRYSVYNEREGHDYGAFLLSRTDPRALRPASQMQTRFAEIYRRNLWLDAESVSGPGSRLSQTVNVRRALPALIRELAVRCLLDAPCGDFHWMRHVALDAAEYIGGDIVPALIARNQQMFGHTRRRFMTLDITTDNLPRADLILCRDCLSHLSFADALAALANMRRSSAQFLLTTTYPERTENSDIETGSWRPINLQLFPFNLPPPLRLINEGCTEGNGVLADKSLGLWRLTDLLDTL